MNRTRAALCAMSGAATLAVLLVGLMAPPARRIDVRWSEAATISDRVRAEDALHLESPEPKGDRTWSYGLRDDSTANAERLVTSPLVEDTSNIDRGRFTLTPELPAVRAAVRAAYQHGVLRAVSGRWPLLVMTIAVIGVGLAWPMLRDAHRAGPSRSALVAILAVSAALRLAIVVSGGQFYWPDEGRYLGSRELVAAIAAGDPGWRMRLLDEPPQVLFRVIGTVPAAVEFVRGNDPRIPAAFFAMFSVVDIWLLARIARKALADQREVLLAAGLFAACSSFLYYSRHLFPYEPAMTCGLLAIVAGIGAAPGWRASVSCGMLSGAAFLTYTGYWTLGGAACAIHVLGSPRLRDGVRRATVAGISLASTIAVFAGMYQFAGIPLLDKVAAFAGDVNQGSYAEGWRLPFAYLWHAEHLLLVVWLAALAWCVYDWRMSVRSSRCIQIGLVGVVFVYAALALTSSALGLFVVYGRLARQLVPFFCLIAAAVIGRQLGRRRAALRRPLYALLALGVVVHTLVSVAPVWRQQFPPQFVRDAERLAARADGADLLLANTHHIYPKPDAFTAPRGARLLLATPHPLQYLPYQYEGFSPEERRALRETDIRMRAFIVVP